MGDNSQFVANRRDSILLQASAFSGTDRPAPPQTTDMAVKIFANFSLVRFVALSAIVFSVFALEIGTALAGKCADAIKQIETALDDLSSNPKAGTAHQSLRAQMHRQPTPGSVARGQEQAIADEQHHRAALEQARAADARNDEAGCLKALPELRHEKIIR